MVQRVADYCIVAGKYGLEQATIWIKAGWIQDGVLGSEKLADSLFQFLVQRLRAANKAHGCHAVAILIQRLVCSCYDLRVIGEAKVVIRAKIEYMGGSAVTSHVYRSLLRACY